MITVVCRIIIFDPLGFRRSQIGLSNRNVVEQGELQVIPD